MSTRLPFTLLTRALRILVLGALALASVSSARAASITLDPVRIELSTDQRTATVRVRNASAEPVIVQAEILSWSQRDGGDVYAPTREMLVTPTVVTIPARSDQIVRVALRRDQDPTLELAYRLYVQEIPPSPKPGSVGLNVALRIGVPIFVAPIAGTVKPQLAWRAAPATNGALTLSVHNAGTGSARLIQTELSTSGGLPIAHLHDLAYVLPGQTRRWTIAPQQLKHSPPLRGDLRVRAESYVGTIDQPVTQGER
jgi:fimbrial chaperone protein